MTTPVHALVPAFDDRPVLASAVELLGACHAGGLAGGRRVRARGARRAGGRADEVLVLAGGAQEARELPGLGLEAARLAVRAGDRAWAGRIHAAGTLGAFRLAREVVGPPRDAREANR